MTREWKPGEVVMVPFDAGHRMLLVTEYGGVFSDGYGVDEQMVREFVDVRPLVVIDPEDRDDVARLVNLYEDRRPGNTRLLDHMTTALREFANPTPPKPAEPTGLGAVVEDAKGNRWVRFCETSSPAWCSEPYDDEDYADIDVVRVLSEGVTP